MLIVSPNVGRGTGPTDAARISTPPEHRHLTRKRAAAHPWRFFPAQPAAEPFDVSSLPHPRLAGIWQFSGQI
jgi:hypothetical protein